MSNTELNVMDEYMQMSEEYYEDSAMWEDDSHTGCSDCPDDLCDGHCMSCAYRSY